MPSSPGEVRIHQTPCARTQRAPAVPGDARASQRFLCLEGSAAQPLSQRAKDDQRLLGSPSRPSWRVEECTATASPRWTCVSWARTAASTVWRDCSRVNGYAHRLGIGAGHAEVAASPLSSRPTIYSGNARSMHPVSLGSSISPTSESTKVGCIWLWCSICSRAKWLAGQWDIASTLHWCWTRSTLLPLTSMSTAKGVAIQVIRDGVVQGYRSDLTANGNVN